MTKSYVPMALASFAMTTLLLSGCGQKKESISFDEALKKELLTFEYRTIECERGSRSTDYCTPVAPSDVPNDLQFTPEEAARVSLDRGPKGTIVRITATRADGKPVALEAEMDDSRVFTGTTLVRGRDTFAYRTVDLVRHVGPRLQEMLRRKAGD